MEGGELPGTSAKADTYKLRKEKLEMLNKKGLKNEIYSLEEISKKTLTELEQLIKRAPKNVKLRGFRHGNSYQYFLRKSGTKENGTYIKKKDIETARIMAKIEYNENLLEEINRRRLDIQNMLNMSNENVYVTALNRMTEAKRNLISIPFVSDEEYMLNWLHQDFEKMGFKENMPEYYTRKGLRVRSKTEVIIADILDEAAVPFIYEKPLRLNTDVVHPDFTLLNMKNKKEIYWEHFGMMDDIEYRNNAFLKIRKYEEAGLFQHDSLMWTFETSKYQINTKQLRKMIAGLKETLGC